jgi:hypothetical protein
MPMLRPAARAGRGAVVVTGPTSAPLALTMLERFGTDPLLVLDVGEFLTRCRLCDWTSTRESTPDAALAAFDTHVCEQPA